MACCKICCGCKECDEGEEGKCCCGQDCCQPGTYCCNAECVQPCSEGQEGDCKCTDACCYQSEYCCDGACVGACAEGDQGPCKCGSTCCAEGEYCCNGVCQEEPCDQNVCYTCPPGNVPNYLTPYQLVDAGDGTKRCCGVGFFYDGVTCVSEDEFSDATHPAVFPRTNCVPYGFVACGGGAYCPEANACIDDGAGGYRCESPPGSGMGPLASAFACCDGECQSDYYFNDPCDQPP